MRPGTLLAKGQQILDPALLARAGRSQTAFDPLQQRARHEPGQIAEPARCRVFREVRLEQRLARAPQRLSARARAHRIGDEGAEIERRMGAAHDFEPVQVEAPVRAVLDAVEAEVVDADYARHCRAARAIAEASFDARKVLASLLNQALG